MRKITFLLLSLIFVGCSTEESKDNSNQNESGTDQSELSKYMFECSGFVKFDPKNASFLNFLISKGYDLNNDSKISCDEASKITILDLGDSGFVNNLVGIESFQNLKTITGYVQLDKNAPDTTTDVLNLYNNSNLENINFNIRSKSNMITTISTIVLPKNSKLINLDCTSAYVKTLLNSGSQTNLETIKCLGSGITGSIDLSNSNKLKSVDFNRNSISEIKFSNSPNLLLKTLDIGGTKIENTSGNQLTSIDLKNFPNLESLDISNNKLTDVDLSKNPKLTSLNVSFNKILKVDLTNNKELVHLRLSSTNISILKLDHIPNLRSLYCTNTLIENIDLSNNKLIYHVQVENNQLKNLNLKNGKSSFINSVTATKNNISCITVDNGFTPDPKKWFKDSNTKYCN